MVSNGDFRSTNTTGCRPFVQTGLETLGGEGVWGEVCDGDGLRPSGGLLILYASDLYWRLERTSPASNDNQ